MIRMGLIWSALLVSQTASAGVFDVEKLEDEIAESGVTRVIIQLAEEEDPEKTADGLAQDLRAADLDVKGTIGNLPLAIVQVHDAESLDALDRHPDVRDVFPDYEVRGALGNSLPYIGQPTAVSQGAQGTGRTVCVLDTGVDYTHPAITRIGALGVPFILGSDYVNGDSDPMDDHGHGTNVAGIVVGTAPLTSIYIVKVLDSTNTGSVSSVLSGISECVANAAAFNIEVINMSLGAGPFTAANYPYGLYSSAIQAAQAAGISLVASTGNDAGVDVFQAPAGDPGVIGVAATHVVGGVTTPFSNCTDTNVVPDQVACLSNMNTATDLLAPGVTINAAALGGGTSAFSGTSQAAPHVSGALVAIEHRYGNLTPDQALFQLRQTAVPVFDARSGYTVPRLNLGAAATNQAPPSITQLNEAVEGGATGWELYDPFSPNQNYILALSFGTSVGIPLGDGRVFPLDQDALFDLSVNNPSSINLSNTTGTLDANGRVQFGISPIPSVAPIPFGSSGLTVYTAYITVDPTLTGIPSITGISAALPVPIQ